MFRTSKAARAKPSAAAARTSRAAVGSGGAGQAAGGGGGTCPRLSGQRGGAQSSSSSRKVILLGYRNPTLRVHENKASLGKIRADFRAHACGFAATRTHAYHDNNKMIVFLWFLSVLNFRIQL
jgi:hypothetical protein